MIQSLVILSTKCPWTPAHFFQLRSNGVSSRAAKSSRHSTYTPLPTSQDGSQDFVPRSTKRFFTYDSVFITDMKVHEFRTGSRQARSVSRSPSAGYRVRHCNSRTPSQRPDQRLLSWQRAFDRTQICRSAATTEYGILPDLGVSADTYVVLVWAILLVLPDNTPV